MMKGATKAGTSTSLVTACMAILTADEWAAEAIAATWVVVCVVANSYPKVTSDSVSVEFKQLKVL